MNNNISITEDFIKSNDEELFEIVGIQEENIEVIQTAPYSYWREVFKVLMKKSSVWICLGLFALVIFFTIFGLMIKSYDTNITQFDKYVAPNAQNWFGTDNKGRDLWTLTWKGTQLSLLLSILVSLVNAVLGLTIGSIWGFFPKLDPYMIELRNFINNVPALLFNMLFMKLFLVSGMDAFFALLIVMCIFGWLPLASTIRNQIIIIRNREFNIASKTLGSKSGTMITHNLLPQLVSVIVTLLSNTIPMAIDQEVSLSFFGLSMSTPERPSLGYIINAGAQDTEWVTFPHIVFLPALVTIIITVTCYYIGFALADAADPKTHR